MKSSTIFDYYRDNAALLAGLYESATVEQVHPDLVGVVQQRWPNQKIHILDIGAGTGRDAAWLASQGHDVTAAEPSKELRSIGRKIHKEVGIKWTRRRLEGFRRSSKSEGPFDLILLSAVWMHIPPEERLRSLRLIHRLLRDGGIAYVTLRLGPAEPNRGIFAVSKDEFVELCGKVGATVTALPVQADLLQREHILWQPMLMGKRLDSK